MAMDQTCWKKDLVLIAKNTLVWLYQLSQKYERPINRIDEIPLEELRELRDLGITGLWLIGIWERSPASRKIKELYGRTGTIASAYSILEYEIAENLGGPQALEKLKRDAHKCGVMIGCDIVPNHTGLDAQWLVDHPEWYIQADENRYSYWTFDTPDLSRDARVTIQLEEGYYKQIGAAEVFRYTNNQTGKISYIYHGNDGTSMPWNDTAQLNYLLPEVREAVRKTILNTARRFDIIRLDAAMTLTRQHYKRLWFPTLDGSQHIPTRENYEMPQEQYDARMPNEFWREVIQDVEAKAPHTLLIAEAFWLMEGYFIQDLGMHRVYNSAFMNMLKNEDNRKFKSCLRDMSAFDSCALDHLINYLTTPDEESAVNQFGRGEKYFGVLTLAAVMPGLPMIGHGQLEGYRERYGMDYGKPHLSEQPDLDFYDQHKTEIAPLLNQRGNFTSCENFQLLDFESDVGEIIDDVIVFQNEVNGFKSLVVFNNCSKQQNGFLLIECKNIAGTIDLRDLISKEISYSQQVSGNVLRLNVPLEPYEVRVFEIA